MNAEQDTENIIAFVVKWFRNGFDPGFPGLDVTLEEGMHDYLAGDYTIKITICCWLLQ